jgi:putative NADH-flavin reductase
VGCGCRGRELGRELAARGHAVRGTTRDSAKLAAIEADGLEAVQADPDRLGTLVGQLAGVTVVCWLLGTATGELEAVHALHGDRLESLLGTLVDSGARGLVYEAGGSVDPDALSEGARRVREAGARNRMPVQVVDADPADVPFWLAGMRDAVDAVLGA